MATKKPVVRRQNIKSCEACMHKKGDFFHDTVDPNVVRVYCKARHDNVDAELMNNNCDFWAINPSFEKPKEMANPYGL